MMQRFAAKTRRDDATGCLIWTGAKDPRGYGRFHLNRGTHFAHILAWQWATGQDRPEGMDIDHTCRNRACVEPSHLRCLPAHDNRSDNSHKRKTHCPKGHSEWGTRIREKTPGGRSRDLNGKPYTTRYCRVCARERMAATRAEAHV